MQQAERRGDLGRKNPFDRYGCPGLTVLGPHIRSIAVLRQSYCKVRADKPLSGVEAHTDPEILYMIVV